MRRVQGQYSTLSTRYRGEHDRQSVRDLRFHAGSRHAQGFTLLALPTGVLIRLTMSYTASTKTLVTSATTNGVSIGNINSVRLSSSFTDFRVGAFAIESYSDAGQDPRYGGSLLAHGSVDNLLLTIPG